MATTLTTTIPEAIRDVFSKELIHIAQPRTKFAQFAKKRNDLKTTPGASVKFTKFNNLALGGQLTEGTAIVDKQLGTSEVSITVAEYGNATKVSELALNVSMYDIMQEAAIALGNDAAKVLDFALRNSALSTTNIVYGNGGTSGATAGVFNAKTIKDAVEYLSENNAPRIDGETYVCIAHPHQLRQLRDDAAWISTHQYQGVENIYRGEVGMYEGVRFVETTQMPALTAPQAVAKYGVGTPAVWEAVIFGENSFAWAEALEIEMRDNGVEDYGRIHGLAWYAIWGFGLIEETNIFRIVTS